MGTISTVLGDREDVLHLMRLIMVLGDSRKGPLGRLLPPCSPRLRESQHHMARCGLTFRLSRLGHLHVDVQLSTNVGLETEATLTFSLAADQSYLPTWMAALSHALDVFPPSLHSPDTAPDVHRK
jgi:hypothetical protein